MASNCGNAECYCEVIPLGGSARGSIDRPPGFELGVSADPTDPCQGRPPASRRFANRWTKVSPRAVKQAGRINVAAKQLPRSFEDVAIEAGIREVSAELITRVAGCRDGKYGTDEQPLRPERREENLRARARIALEGL